MENTIIKIPGVSDKNIMMQEQVYGDSFEDNGTIEADIQVAFMNMLRDKGLITDSVYSASINKIYKGM